jgi:hypothetical protein
MSDKAGITVEHFKKLIAPFPADDHEFKPPRNYVYIRETPLCERIEEVDLSWEWRIETVNRYDPKGMIATTIGHLTICGVTRSGEGSQTVEFQKNSELESGEAEKGSETDALKRAARKFGIGRYLLQCPANVKGYGKELDMWLREVARSQGAASIQVSAALPSPAKASDAPLWWGIVLPELRDDYKMTSAEFTKFTNDAKAEVMANPSLKGMSEHAAKTYLESKLVLKKEAS